MNRVFRRAITTTTRVLAEAEPVTNVSAELRLNLAVPARALLDGVDVERVTLPGRAGRFGVEKSSPAMLAELRPGVVNVIHIDGRSEDFFVPGGFAFVHGDNRIDVSTPEGVRLDDIDSGERVVLRLRGAPATERRQRRLGVGCEIGLEGCPLAPAWGPGSHCPSPFSVAEPADESRGPRVPSGGASGPPGPPGGASRLLDLCPPVLLCLPQTASAR